MLIKLAKILIVMISLIFCPILSAKSDAKNTSIQCDVNYEGEFIYPWNQYGKRRIFNIDVIEKQVKDVTVSGSYQKFDIMKNDAYWIEARSKDLNFIKEYLKFDIEHLPKYAEIIINKINLSIQMRIITDRHVDQNEKMIHVGSIVYDGTCFKAKSKI